MITDRFSSGNSVKYVKEVGIRGDSIFLTHINLFELYQWYQRCTTQNKSRVSQSVNYHNMTLS